MPQLPAGVPLPRQLSSDRLARALDRLDGPLVRLFGIHPSIAVKYVPTAHPDKALPRIR
ncbi:hypothetical protein [Streptomyces decoyicus]